MFLRLRAQARFCVVAIACRKLGIAIAASRPMMATTTMISMRVNPTLYFVFMAFLIFYGARRHVWRGIGVPAVDDKVHIFELCCREKVSLLIADEGELLSMTVPVKCAALFFGPLFGTLPTADMLVLGSKVSALSIAFGSVERRATLSPFRWHRRPPRRKLGRANQTDNLKTALCEAGCPVHCCLRPSCVWVRAWV